METARRGDCQPWRRTRSSRIVAGIVAGILTAAYISSRLNALQEAPLRRSTAEAIDLEFTGIAMPGSSGEGRGAGLLNLLFMADIGHPRGYAGPLTSPWPMDKAAGEGSYSLYEGLHDYVVRQGVRPNAVAVVGDVAYGGGDAVSCNGTRDAFQKYLGGVVPEERVFPVIGNHDVHYLGCSSVELLQSACYFGARRFFWGSSYQMSFWRWRENWLTAFPGLRSAILPASSDTSSEQAHRGSRARWLAPLRYNINLDAKSHVYLIAGLISGSGQFNWNGDTPGNSIDAQAPGGAEVECAFLQDSLATGRRLGKSIFVYMTHAFERGCDDWSLIRQVDVWISGHQHDYWQSALEGAVELQEQRHYPLRVLIGNGGFDQATIDVVSFGHAQEHVEGNRVKLTIKVQDTCQSVGSCPVPSMASLGLSSCWATCAHHHGHHGSDGDSPRVTMATPSRHGFGFVLDAPLQSNQQLGQEAPFAGTWKLRLGATADSSAAQGSWLALSDCGGRLPSTARCLVSAPSREQAAVFTVYGAEVDKDKRSGSVRLALEDENQGPVVRGDADSNGANILYRHWGFWDVSSTGRGLLRPSDAWEFKLVQGPFGWQLLDVGWLARSAMPGSWQLFVVPGSAVNVSFHPALAA